MVSQPAVPWLGVAREQVLGEEGDVLVGCGCLMGPSELARTRGSPPGPERVSSFTPNVLGMAVASDRFPIPATRPDGPLRAGGRGSVGDVSGPTSRLAQGLKGVRAHERWWVQRA